MTDRTTNHNKIAGKFYARALLALEEKGYEVYRGDIGLWMPRYRFCSYPNVIIIEGKPIYDEGVTTTITNPKIIIEMVSESTISYNAGNKFRCYRSIPSFEEYILIEPDSYFVEQYFKTSDKQWILKEYEGEDSILILNSIDFTISFQELYKQVDFFEINGEDIS